MIAHGGRRSDYGKEVRIHRPRFRRGVLDPVVFGHAAYCVCVCRWGVSFAFMASLNVFLSAEFEPSCVLHPGFEIGLPVPFQAAMVA